LSAFDWPRQQSACLGYLRLWRGRHYQRNEALEDSPALRCSLPLPALSRSGPRDALLPFATRRPTPSPPPPPLLPRLLNMSAPSFPPHAPPPRPAMDGAPLAFTTTAAHARCGVTTGSAEAMAARAPPAATRPTCGHRVAAGDAWCGRCRRVRLRVVNWHQSTGRHGRRRPPLPHGQMRKACGRRHRHMRDRRRGRGLGRHTHGKRAARAQSSLALAAAIAADWRRVRGGRLPRTVLLSVERQAAHRWPWGEGRGTGGGERVPRTRVSAEMRLTRFLWATAAAAERGRCAHTTKSGRSSCHLAPRRLATDRQWRGGSFLRLPPRPPPSRRRGAVKVDAPSVFCEAARAADRGMAVVQRSTIAVSPLRTGRDAARSVLSLCCAVAAGAAAAARGGHLCKRAHADASRHCGGVGASQSKGCPRRRQCASVGWVWGAQVGDLRWPRRSGSQRPAPPRLGSGGTPGVSTDGGGGGGCDTRRRRRWWPYAFVAAVAECGGSNAVVASPLSSARVRDACGGVSGHNGQ